MLLPKLCIKLLLFLGPSSLFPIQHPHVSLAFMHPVPSFHHHCLKDADAHTSLQRRSSSLGRTAPGAHLLCQDPSDGASLPPSCKCSQSFFFSCHILPRCVFQPSPTTPRHPMSAAPSPPCAGYMHVRWHCIQNHRPWNHRLEKTSDTIKANHPPNTPMPAKPCPAVPHPHGV